jgi:hypothetical protein
MVARIASRSRVGSRATVDRVVKGDHADVDVVGHRVEVAEGGGLGLRELGAGHAVAGVEREHRRTTHVGVGGVLCRRRHVLAVDLHRCRREIDRVSARHREEDLELIAVALDMVDGGGVVGVGGATDADHRAREERCRGNRDRAPPGAPSRTVVRSSQSVRCERHRVHGDRIVRHLLQELGPQTGGLQRAHRLPFSSKPAAVS